MNARTAARLAAAPARIIGGVRHVECSDCGEWQSRSDIVERADEGRPAFFCRRCSDIRDTQPGAGALLPSLGAPSRSADFDGARRVLGGDVYDALVTEALATLQPGETVGRVLAGRLVARVAALGSGEQSARAVVALSLLGYEKLARELAARVGAIHVGEEDGELVVKAPFSEAFNWEVKTVRGSWWDEARRVRRVPRSAKAALWSALCSAFPGSLVVGVRGLAVARVEAS
jgi:hypothetical protein